MFSMSEEQDKEQLTAPLHTENQVIISTPMRFVDSLLRTRFVFKADKREALPGTRLAIVADVHPSNPPKHTEQVS